MIRPGQERVLADCIGSRAEKPAQYDVTKEHTEEFVSETASSISSTLNTSNGVCNVNSLSTAMGALDIVLQYGTKAVANAEFETASTSAATTLLGKASVIDVDVVLLQFIVGTCTMGAGDAAVDSSDGVAATTLLNVLESKIDTEVKAETAPIIANATVLTFNA